jgi:hypothetical protein
MPSCEAVWPTSIPAFCWRITRHNTLAALADLYPQWLVRDLLPLPPSGGIPREATKSLSPPSSASLRAKAAGRSLRRSQTRTVESRAVKMEASRDIAERLALIVPGRDEPRCADALEFRAVV